MNLESLLAETLAKHASDLHIIVGFYPTIRQNNILLGLREHDTIVTPEEANKLPSLLLNPAQKMIFEENKEIDFGYVLNSNRFRVNLYMTRGNCAASFRVIPTTIKTIGELNLPDVFNTFTDYRQGLILFTGPTGEGKSTSLAAIINELNIRHSRHVVTIEDPIEFMYPAGRSIISQRELSQDTLSWNKALRSALREDPDIVLIGEMRDYDTVQSALTIAETGHLVFSTLHTGSTVEAIARIIDVFPSHQQNQIRNSLSNSLVAVVAQRLIPTSDGLGRIPAVEILMNDPAVASLIREGKNHQLDNVIETSENTGMILFEKYLAKLYTLGHITKETALTYAIRRNIISRLI